jgi:hypothetical protein
MMFTALGVLLRVIMGWVKEVGATRVTGGNEGDVGVTRVTWG